MDNNKQWVCPKCGRVNSNKYCGGCGEKKPEETSFQPPASLQSSIPPQTMQPSMNEIPPNMPKSGKPNRKIRYILILVIVILIGILAGIFFVNKNKAAEQTDTVTTTEEQAVPKTNETENKDSTTDTKTQEAEKSTNEEQGKSAETSTNETTNLDYLKDKVVPNKDKQKNTDISDAGVRFFEYHRSITEHNLRQAYSYLSKDFQNRMTYEGWAPGFDKTLSSNPSNLQLISAEPNRVEFSYNLEARDKENNKVKVQSFKGTTILIKQNGSWKIDSIIADKTGEHIE